MRELEYLTRTR